MGSDFCEFRVFWTILQKLVPTKTFAKILIHENCETDVLEII